MCVHLCNCKLYGWILMVSQGFKTSGQCLLKGGKYVARMNNVTSLPGGIKTKGFTRNFIKSLIMGLSTPGEQL